MNQHQKERQIAVWGAIRTDLQKRGFVVTAELPLERNGGSGQFESDLCVTDIDGEQYHIVLINRSPRC